MMRLEIFAGALMLVVGIYYASNLASLWRSYLFLSSGSSLLLRPTLIVSLFDLPLAWVLSVAGSAVLVDGLWRKPRGPA